MFFPLSPSYLAAVNLLLIIHIYNTTRVGNFLTVCMSYFWLDWYIIMIVMIHEVHFARWVLYIYTICCANVTILYKTCNTLSGNIFILIISHHAFSHSDIIYIYVYVQRRLNYSFLLHWTPAHSWASYTKALKYIFFASVTANNCIQSVSI